MRNDDLHHEDALEKTQFMGSHAENQSTRLQDTQPVPRMEDVSAKSGAIQPPLSSTRSPGVRELKPISQKPDKKSGKKLTSRRKKVLMLTGGFIFALLCGFFVSGYYHDRQQAADNDRLHQTQQMEQKSRNLQQQEQSLREQRDKLEQEKKALEEKQKNLQSQADRAAGRNEQINADSAGSAVSKIWDTVTGKNQQRQQTSKENEAKSTQASNDASAVGKSIDEAQAMINDVDSRIRDLDEMKQQAQQVKDVASSAYAEHAGTIDQAVYYISEGASYLKGLLSK